MRFLDKAIDQNCLKERHHHENPRNPHLRPSPLRRERRSLALFGEEGWF